MKIAITGASGLIGTKMIEEFSNSDFQLTCLSRKQQVSHNNHVNWIVGDLQVDGVAQHLIKDQDVIIHLAHETTPLLVSANPIEELYLNINPSLKLIQAVKESSNPPYIIYFSSGGAIYGEPISPQKACSETDRCHPLTYYGIQKLIIERYLHNASSSGSCRCTILRIANAYGEVLNADRIQGLIGTSITRVLSGHPLRLIGNPNNVRDYIHLSDIIESVKRALFYSGTFNIFNIGSGVGYSVLEVLNTILRITGGNSSIESHQVSGDNLLTSWNILDITRAKNELKWSPKISLEMGIQSIYTSLKLANSGSHQQ